jgi:hypothetical protein
MLARLQRSPGQLEVRVRRRDHVDDVDVVARDQRLPIVGGLWDFEVARELLGPCALDIADRHDLTPLVALPTGNVRELRPGASAQDADPKLV